VKQIPPLRSTPASKDRSPGTPGATPASKDRSPGNPGCGMTNKMMSDVEREPECSKWLR
jgi:hypothetical protein